MGTGVMTPLARRRACRVGCGRRWPTCGRHVLPSWDAPFCSIGNSPLCADIRGGGRQQYVQRRGRGGGGDGGGGGGGPRGRNARGKVKRVGVRMVVWPTALRFTCGLLYRGASRAMRTAICVFVCPLSMRCSSKHLRRGAMPPTSFMVSVLFSVCLFGVPTPLPSHVWTRSFFTHDVFIFPHWRLSFVFGRMTTW